jgi:hypothetical protein
MKRGFYLLPRPWGGDISAIALHEIDGFFKSSPATADKRGVRREAGSGDNALGFQEAPGWITLTQQVPRGDHRHRCPIVFFDRNSA